MADIKFSELPKATTSKDSDEIAILQDGVNKMIASPVLESKIINKTVSRVIEQGGASLNMVNLKGVVPTYADLALITPTPELNDAYQVEADGLVYVYTENGFQADGEGFKVQPDADGTVEHSNVNYIKDGFSRINNSDSLPMLYFPSVMPDLGDYYFSDEDFFVNNSSDLHYLTVFSEKRGTINVAYISVDGNVLHNEDLEVNEGYNTFLLTHQINYPAFNTKHFIFIKQNQPNMLRFRAAGAQTGYLQYLTNIQSVTEQVLFSIFKPNENAQNKINSFDKLGLNELDPIFGFQNLNFLPNNVSNSGIAYSYTHPELYITSTKRLAGVHVYCIKSGEVLIDFIKVNGNPIITATAEYLNDVNNNKFQLKKGWNYIPEEKINIPFFDGVCYIAVRADNGILGYNNLYSGNALEVNGTNNIATFTNALHCFFIDTYNFDLVDRISNGEKYIELPKGQIDLNQNIILDGVHLKGKGVNCCMIKDVRPSGGNLIDLKNYAEISGVWVKGQNNTLNKSNWRLNTIDEIRALTGIGSDNGITISSIGCKINNVQVTNFGGRGIVISGQSTRLIHSFMNNVQCFNNFIGFDFTGSGEYCTLSNLASSNNIIGIMIGAGNTFISSGTFNDNRHGLYMIKTGNDSHGCFSACQFNHSAVYSMIIDNISHGHSFVGCHVFEGDIWLINSIGFNFTGGTIDANIYAEGGKTQRISYTSFQNAYWDRNNGVHHNFNGITSYLKMVGNFFMLETGENDGIINNQ